MTKAELLSRLEFAEETVIENTLTMLEHLEQSFGDDFFAKIVGRYLERLKPTEADGPEDWEVFNASKASLQAVLDSH